MASLPAPEGGGISLRSAVCSAPARWRASGAVRRLALTPRRSGVLLVDDAFDAEAADDVHVRVVGVLRAAAELLARAKCFRWMTWVF